MVEIVEKHFSKFCIPGYECGNGRTGGHTQVIVFRYQDTDGENGGNGENRGNIIFKVFIIRIPIVEIVEMVEIHFSRMCISG